MIVIEGLSQCFFTAPPDNGLSCALLERKNKMFFSSPMSHIQANNTFYCSFAFAASEIPPQGVNRRVNKNADENQD